MALKNVHIWSKTKDPNLPSSKATQDTFNNHVPVSTNLIAGAANVEYLYLSHN